MQERYRAAPAPSRVPQQRQKVPVKVQAADALARLEDARSKVDQGDFPAALDQFTFIVKQYPELALSEYARIGRALLLYQQGQVGLPLLLYLLLY